jgi:2,4-dienoyl-CoA reductase (NADPH2)
LNVKEFLKEWGVDENYQDGGALMKASPEPPAREVYLLQRTNGKVGAKLGKTTGWIHRASLKMRDVKMIGGVQYEKIDDKGLHLTINGEFQILEVDNVVICAGQLPLRDLFEPLEAKGMKVHLIGGADEAKELDAKRAIDQGSRVSAAL